MKKMEDMENRNNHKNQKTVKTDITVKTASAFFSESLKCLKSLMQIFIESAKSAKSIFATFATFASANFVGKASCESTERYRVKSRIPSCLFRYSLDSNLSRFSLASLICLCMLTIGVGNAWGAEGTLTITRSCFPSGSLAYDTDDSWSATTSTSESISGKADIYSIAAQTTLQTKNAKTPYYNTTSLPGAITKIEVDLASGTDRVYDVYASATAAITSTAGLSPIGRLTEGCAVDISTAYNYRYFALQCTGGASTLNNIVITYETVPGKAIFTRIDAVGDLKDGDEIIFVNQAETYACAMRQNDNNRAIKPITVSSHKYTYVPSDSVQVFTVKINASSQYGFHAGAGHLYSLSGKNQIKTNSDNLCTNPSGNAAWTLSASSSVFSVTNVSNTSYLMQFNGTSYFAQYTTSQIKPYIFKRKSTYDVTWMANGVDWSEHGTPTTSGVSPGGKVSSLPTAPTSAACDDSKVFVGWSASEIDGEDDDAPDDLFTTADGAPTVDDDVTYYAVFATESAGSTEYVFTAHNAVTAGTYVIASYNTTTSKYVALTGGIVTSSSNKDLENETTGFTLTNNKFTTLPTGACEFTLAGNSSDGFTIKNGETNGYLGYTTQETSRRLAFDNDYSSYTWKVASETETNYPDGCYIYRGLAQDYTISTNSNNTSSQVRGYSGNTSYKPIYFFKKGSSTSYSAYATTCVVAYDIVLDDGEVATTNNGSAKVAADAKELTDITAPTKTGYKVAKYTTSNGSGSDIADKDGKLNASVSVSATTWTNSDKEWKKGSGATFYASWTPISYSVRFNANDEGKTGTASGSMSNQNFAYGTAQYLTTNAYSLSGYTFQGWATSAGGSVAHTDGKSVSNLSTTDGDVVDLYAVWQANTYDVTLAATDETSSVGSQVVTATYGSAMPTTLKGSGDVDAPERTGYTFDGWEYSSTQYYSYNSGTSTIASAHVWDIANSTTTLTPRWNVNSYTLAWDKNGGNALTGDYTSGSVNYGATITAPNTPTRSGYDFAGWDDGSGVVTPATTMPAGDVTYTATWTKKTASGWTWTYNSAAIPDPFVIYVGINKTLDITWDPSDLLSEKKGYTVTKTDSYVAQGAKANDYYTMRGAAGVTEVINTTVTFSLSGLSDVEINVTVKPQPRVHFVDNIHGESFDDLLPTVVSYVATFTKSTPTHSNVSDPGSNYNTCERQHIHLVGWIRSDWANEHPGASHSQITSAGNDDAGNPYYYTAGADIDVEAQDGKTFYAVWAKEE